MHKHRKLNLWFDTWKRESTANESDPCRFATMCWFKLRANESGCDVMEMLSPKQRCSLIGATEHSIIVTRRHNHLPYALNRMEMELINKKIALPIDTVSFNTHAILISLSFSLSITKLIVLHSIIPLMAILHWTAFIAYTLFLLICAFKVWIQTNGFFF